MKSSLRTNHILIPLSSLLWLETWNDTQTWEKTLTLSQGCTQKSMYDSQAQFNAQLLWIPWKSGISSNQTCKLGALHSLLEAAVLQIRLYRARSKSGKQARLGAAWMTACETLLLEKALRQLFLFYDVFLSGLGPMPTSASFEGFFSLWTLHSCFTGKQSHGSTSKKSICSSSMQISVLSFHLLWAPHTYSNPLQPQSLLAAVGLAVPSSFER